MNSFLQSVNTDLHSIHNNIYDTKLLIEKDLHVLFKLHAQNRTFLKTEKFEKCK